MSETPEQSYPVDWSGLNPGDSCVGSFQVFHEQTNLRTNECVPMLWTPSVNCIPPSHGGAGPRRAASALSTTLHAPFPSVGQDSHVLINYGGFSASWAWTPGFSARPRLLLLLLPAKLTSQTNVLSRCFPHINNQN